MDHLRALVARLRAVPPVVGLGLVATWMALIWLLSSRPPSDLSTGSPTGAWLTNLAHAPEYAALALWLAIGARRGGADVAPIGRAGVWIVIFCVAHGVVDELHQSTVPGRDASVLDVLTDLCGAASLVAVLRAAGDRARFARAVLLGLVACTAAAGLATFVPRLAPETTWL